MTEYNWERFVTRIPIQAEIKTLYDAWATRQGIEYWFLRTSEYQGPEGKLRANDEHVEPGDTYLWQWHGWSDEIGEHGKILDCNGLDYFQFTFGDECICSVTLKEEHGQSIVELIQSHIPTDDQGKHQWHLGCKTGWTFYLANMKSLYEGGIDLRNKNEDIKRVVNS
jgi:hypothetical protein